MIYSVYNYTILRWEDLSFRESIICFAFLESDGWTIRRIPPNATDDRGKRPIKVSFWK